MNTPFNQHTKFTDSLERQMFHYTSERPDGPAQPLLSVLGALLRRACTRFTRRKRTYRSH